MKILNRIITFVTTVFVIIACIVFAATAICKIGILNHVLYCPGQWNPKFILEVSALSIKKFHMIKSKPEILLLLKQVKIQW